MPAGGKDLMKERERDPENVRSFILSWSGLLCHRTRVIKEGLASFIMINIA